MHDLDTALLRTFVVLSQTRSFGRAGERVGRSQSAISAQIRKLEDQLGCRLVARDTRNVALTPEGEKLLGYARQMVELSDAMLGRFRHSDIAGEVRFGSPEDFASFHLPGILAGFAETHERVLLHVSCDLTLRLIEQLEAGEHDLIIIKQDPRSLYPGAVPLWREELVWVGRGAPGPSCAAVLEDCAGRGRPLPLVLSPAPCVYRSRALGALDAAGIAWTHVFTSPSIAGCIGAVRAGLGTAVMPRTQVPPDLWAATADQGWPPLAEAEICLVGTERLSPAAEALAGHVRRMQVPSGL